jgi:hypothetical protein
MRKSFPSKITAGLVQALGDRHRCGTTASQNRLADRNGCGRNSGRPLRFLILWRAGRSRMQEDCGPARQLGFLVGYGGAPNERLRSPERWGRWSASGRDRLMGVWKLVSIEVMVDGKTLYPYAEHPVGRLTYDSGRTHFSTRHEAGSRINGGRSQRGGPQLRRRTPQHS